MKLKISQLSLFGAALVAFYVTPAKNLLAESVKEKESYQIADEYPKNFVETYTKDCVEQASDHLEKEDASKLCQCMIETYQKDYTYQEYRELSPEAQQDLGMNCFEEIDSEA